LFVNGAPVKNLLNKRPVRAVFAGLALSLLILAVFFCRKPVILVTDRPFYLLYGEERIRLKRIGLSLRHFRQIKTADLADGAGPELAARTALDLSRRPRAVFFPYRYREGAWHYLVERPGSPVVILGGRNQRDNSLEGPLWLCTDTEADLYQAGVLAGIIARDLENGEEKRKTNFRLGIALYRQEGADNSQEDAENSAFIRGTGEYWSGIPIFSPDSDEQGLACAVLLGDHRFSQEKKPLSLILFTWMDPSLAPRKTLAIFDDSPWAQMGPALRILNRGAGGTEMRIPSKILVLKKNKMQKN